VNLAPPSVAPPHSPIPPVYPAGLDLEAFEAQLAARRERADRDDLAREIASGILREVRALVPSAAAPAQPAPRRRATAAGLLSARLAATLLGVNRSTLARLVAQGAIPTVPKGKRRGYRAADVDALVSSGFTLDGPAPSPPRKTKRRPSRRKSAADPSVAARLAAI
jgi:excisionase family DNA binding protein